MERVEKAATRIGEPFVAPEPQAEAGEPAGVAVAEEALSLGPDGAHGAEPPPAEAAPETPSTDSLTRFLQSGLALLEELAAVSRVPAASQVPAALHAPAALQGPAPITSGAGPSPGPRGFDVTRDARSGEMYLKIRLPDPDVLERALRAAGTLLHGLGR